MNFMAGTCKECTFSFCQLWAIKTIDKRSINKTYVYCWLIYKYWLLMRGIVENCCPRGEIQPLPFHRDWGNVTAYLMLGRTETCVALSICVKIKKRPARYDVTSIQAGLSLYILTFDYRRCWAPSSIDSGNKSLFVKTVWKVSKKFRKCGLFNFSQVSKSFTQVLHLKSLPLF